MMLKFYNTLSRSKEEFKPLNSAEVGLYTCGPTVYNFAHIGNLRAYMFADVLKKVLLYNNFQVKHIMNLTDVDDKTIKNSKLEFPEMDPMLALKKFTTRYSEAFLQDLEKLNIAPASFYSKATDYVKEMQELILKIADQGYAYEAGGSVYFDLQKYLANYNYGYLINLDLDNFKKGARVDLDEYEKENIQDFVLWKGQKAGEPFWDFTFLEQNLPGRPGWHIECSAMAKELLGMPFDIHTGGIDLKFPHHEDEIAQNIVGYQIEKPINYWLHNDFILVDGQKMSKSLGNVYSLIDLEQKNISPLAYRYLVLQTHYRSQLNFTWDSLGSAQNGLDNLYNIIRDWNEEEKVGCAEYEARFLEAINDDLDTPKALAIMHELIKDQDVVIGDKKKTLLKFDEVFGLSLGEIKKVEIPQAVLDLAEQREQARQNKDWKKSDELRGEILKLGFEIEDGKEGFKILEI
jgi:cysteinyl-tRNA synthetase